MTPTSVDTLATRPCDHCGGEVPVALWLADGSDHVVMIQSPITVETVDVDATNLAHIRAEQEVRFAYCRSLPVVPTAEVAAPPPCPECAQGKHDNCDGTTWDPVADAPTACPCAEGDHQ